MKDIEIKVGQKWRVVDGPQFQSSNYTTDDILTVSAIENGEGIVNDPLFTFITHLDIKKGLVELIEDVETFDSPTTQIPPVGTKCLYSVIEQGNWFECEVVSQDRPVIYCPHLDDNDGDNNGFQIMDGLRVWYKPLKPKSATQIRMEEIEAKMRELADELKELRDGC